MEIQISKGKGIDTLVSGYSPRKVEEGGEIQVVGETIFKDLLEDYRQFGDPSQREKFIGKSGFVVTDHITKVLSPSEIHKFLLLSTTVPSEDLFGEFIGRLIQNSYDAGYNDFTFDIRSHEAVLGCHLKGTQENPVRLKVLGDLAARSLSGCKYVNVNHEGNLGDLSLIGTWYSTFHFNGSIGKESGIDVSNCTFYTTNRETLSQLLQHVPNETMESLRYSRFVHSKNKIVFISTNGEEEVVRNYQ